MRKWHQAARTLSKRYVSKVHPRMRQCIHNSKVRFFPRAYSLQAVAKQPVAIVLDIGDADNLVPGFDSPAWRSEGELRCWAKSDIGCNLKQMCCLQSPRYGMGEAAGTKLAVLEPTLCWSWDMRQIPMPVTTGLSSE